MKNETDDKIAIAMVEETIRRFPDFKSSSFDKGFWTPLNQKILQGILEKVILPKKARLSIEDKERQENECFIEARKQHSAVESAINSLDHHGLDRCLDHGIYGFERYVALGVVGRNLHRLGGIILEKEQKTLKRRRKLRLAV
jgi:hypothetical protein